MESNKKITYLQVLKKYDIILREIPNFVHNRVLLYGYIDDDLDKFIYLLDEKSGIPEWHELYLEHQILNSQPLVEELINYLNYRGISYKYVRSTAIA